MIEKKDATIDKKNFTKYIFDIIGLYLGIIFICFFEIIYPSFYKNWNDISNSFFQRFSNDLLISIVILYVNLVASLYLKNNRHIMAIYLANKVILLYLLLVFLVEFFEISFLQSIIRLSVLDNIFPFLIMWAIFGMPIYCRINIWKFDGKRSSLVLLYPLLLCLLYIFIICFYHMNMKNTM